MRGQVNADGAPPKSILDERFALQPTGVCLTFLLTLLVVAFSPSIRWSSDLVGRFLLSR